MRNILLGILNMGGDFIMVNEDFDKLSKYQKKERRNYPGDNNHGKDLDPKTNNKKVSNSNPGAEGRDV